ncbi:ComEA family DNA-binding protein [Polyangium jinanense]|uniref:Helix-hairpin-helix domain-containing protein n=1 Tax=Polyangium jinanense TaxID=2829994 RepID=A0A9X4AP46_9BACT|nr:helix-hairpin-helix domain-containing protein [Polyangium jinanense]MDC3953226.1 helix-hairpin-helix domain-containing protein [Polyangium jinanense]MDC3979654.1 helix-hairpin-helix domain-containing protein [Polyangium jinanense]
MELSAEDKQVGARAFFGSIAARLRGSAWMPLAGKAALGVLGFLALAFMGSGAGADLMPRRVGAYLGPPATSASAAAPLPTADAGAGAHAEADAGAGADAGAAADAAAPIAAVTPDGRVILNLATEEDLRKLPGIGATKAKAILALRAKLGRFKRPEDLLRVKGLGRKSLGRLRPKLLIDPP